MTPGKLLPHGADACPGPEQLAAYVDGMLAPADRTDLDRHLAGCADCREVVGDTREALGTLRDGRRPGRWMVTSASLLAVAAALMLAVRPRVAEPAPQGTLTQLVEAVGQRRLVEPRLSGGFAYAPFIVRRGPADPAVSPEFQVAAARLERQFAANPSTPNLRVSASAQLLLGNHDVAVSRLEAASRRAPAADIASDLAAAYLARGQRQNRQDDFVRALAETEIALRARPTPEPLFNRALALENLNLRPQALDAWKAYLAADGDSEWAQEARQHVESLDPPDNDRLFTPRQPR